MLPITAVRHQPDYIDSIPVEDAPTPQVKHLVMMVDPKTGAKSGFTVSTFTESFSELMDEFRKKQKTFPQYRGWIYDSSTLLTPITDDEF